MDAYTIRNKAAKLKRLSTMGPTRGTLFLRGQRESSAYIKRGRPNRRRLLKVSFKYWKPTGLEDESSSTTLHTFSLFFSLSFFFSSHICMCVVCIGQTKRYLLFENGFKKDVLSVCVRVWRGELSHWESLTQSLTCLKYPLIYCRIYIYIVCVCGGLLLHTHTHYIYVPRLYSI